MKKNSIFLAPILAMIAIIALGCTVLEVGNEPSTGPSSASFDPIGDQKEVTARPEFLDPVTLFSDRVYMVRALDGKASKDAVFPGGSDNLVKHIQGKVLEHIKPGIGWLKPPVLEFTVNARGGTEAVKLMTTSGNTGLDELLIRTFSEMPVWRPAKDQLDRATDQVFEFTVTNEGC